MALAPLDRRMTHKLRLRHLELISAIHDYGSVLKASQQMNLTQPAVTKSLQDIEETLGLQLFVRSSRGLVATYYGEVFVRHAKNVLAQIRHSAEELQSLHEGFGGHVTVGTLLAASASLLPGAIIELKKDRPNVAITVFDGTYDVLLPRLRMGDLDLVLGRLPEGPQREGLIHEEFYAERTCLAVRRDHPLTQRKRLTLENLLDEAWLLPVPESHLRRQIERLFAQAKLHLPKNIIESMSALTNRVLLESSDVVGAFPYQVVREEVRQGKLTILPLKLPGTESPVGAIMRSPGDLRPSAAALLEHLRSVGRRLGEED
ncbi:LysR substrate-binding domain-containing protein [Phenylobacterium sp.]|jgi:DNA-binding transcriptional LysR family regulator|uniref:LysR substrate-binding domain-containing protein n=1 Tax=Phenylobacterium sp. TaxID=1871053 RepID=UPI0037C5027E